MTQLRFAQHLRSGAILTSVTLLTWLVLVGVYQTLHPSTSFTISLTAACGATIWSVLFYRLLVQQQPMRVLPRKSDVLFVALAFPAGGSVQYVLMQQFFETTPLTPHTVLLWSPILALLMFHLYYNTSVLLAFRAPPMKVILVVTDEERELLISELHQGGLLRYFCFLTLHELRTFVIQGRTSEISLIIISHSASRDFSSDPTLLRAHTLGVPIADLHLLLSDLSGRIRLGSADLWSYLHSATRQMHTHKLYAALKRGLEPVIALILGVILLPLMLAIALLVRLSSPGPALFRQVRSGYLGKPFVLLKFRSMRIDAERDGPRWASRHDKRSTAFGAFLRRTRLDELPQLWNVVRGEMSFFGPRPERPEMYQKLREEIPLFSLRTVVRPGITGWAQVHYGYVNSVDESRLKLEYDLFYIQHMSPRLDGAILALTVKVLLTGRSSLLGYVGPRLDKRQLLPDERQQLSAHLDSCFDKASPFH